MRKIKVGEIKAFNWYTKSETEFLVWSWLMSKKWEILVSQTQFDKAFLEIKNMSKKLEASNSKFSTSEILENSKKMDENDLSHPNKILKNSWLQELNSKQIEIVIKVHKDVSLGIFKNDLATLKTINKLFKDAWIDLNQSRILLESWVCWKNMLAENIKETQILTDSFYKLYTVERTLNSETKTKFLSNNALHTEVFYDEILPNLKSGETIAIKYGWDEFVFFYKDKNNKTQKLFVDVGNMWPSNNILWSKIHIWDTPNNSNIVDIYINKIQKLSDIYLSKWDTDWFFKAVKNQWSKMLNMNKWEYSKFVKEFNIKADFETYKQAVIETKNFAERRNLHRILDKNILDFIENNDINLNVWVKDKELVLTMYKDFLEEDFFNYKTKNFIKEINTPNSKLNLKAKELWYEASFFVNIKNIDSKPIDVQIWLLQDVLYLRTKSWETGLLDISTTLLDIQWWVVEFNGKNYSDFYKSLKFAEHLEWWVKSDKTWNPYKSWNIEDFEKFLKEKNIENKDASKEYNDLLKLNAEIDKLNNIKPITKENISKIHNINDKINNIKYNNSRANWFKTWEFLRDFKVSEIDWVFKYLKLKNISDCEITGITIEQENTWSLNKISYDIVDEIPKFLLEASKENVFIAKNIEHITFIKDWGGRIRILWPKEIVWSNEFKSVLTEFNNKTQNYLQENIISKDAVLWLIDSTWRNWVKGEKSSIWAWNFKITSQKTMHLKDVKNAYSTIFTK